MEQDNNIFSGNSLRNCGELNYCPNCGFNICNSGRYCVHCGINLDRYRNSGSEMNVADNTKALLKLYADKILGAGERGIKHLRNRLGRE